MIIEFVLRLLGLLFYLSITLGLFQNYNSLSSDISYEYSGLLGGLVLSLFHDWIGLIGSISLITLLWILLFVGFFNLDLYSSFQSAVSFIQSKIKSLIEFINSKLKEKGIVWLQEEVKKIIDDESFLHDITEEESKENTSVDILRI